MTPNARRKQRARSRAADLQRPYAAARHSAPGTSVEPQLCPAWCVAHETYPGDDLNPADAGATGHDGISVPVGRSEAGGDTAIMLSATIHTLPDQSTIDVVVRVGDDGSDLWWTLPEAAVLHTALTELIDGTDQPLDAAGCPSWCVHHELIEPDDLDPDSLASVVHESARIPVPSTHDGEFAVHSETYIYTDGRQHDEILITLGKFAPVVWTLDTARTAHTVLAAALHTAATDPRMPPAAITARS